MNTAQLTILWYAGLIIVGITLVNARKESSTNLLMIATFVFAGLLIYTLRPHPSARKKVVLFWVSLPFILAIIAGVFWTQYHNYRENVSRNLVRVNQIELDNMWLTQNSSGKVLLTLP